MNRQLYDNYVIQVVKHGSLTNAAKALGISQPALSQGLNVLEKELGIKIFNRRANPILLTAEGELYYRHISRLAALNDSFEKKIEDMKNEVNSAVTIGSPAVYVRSVVGPAIRAMNRPGFRVSVRTASVEQIIRYAESGTVDCFISTTKDLPETFEKKFIFREEIVLCLPADSPIETFDFEKLRACCFISLEPQFPLQQTVDGLMKASGFEPKSRIVIDQVSEAVNLVEEGLGVCFASKEAAAHRNVRTVPTGLVGRDIYIAYDRDAYRTEACEALIRAIAGGEARE